jgi:hypothetical protein
LLGLAPEYAPDPTCLKEGLEIFKEEHHDRLKIQSPLRFLTGLGAALWRLKLAAEAAADVVEDDPGDNQPDDRPADDGGEERVWTPEAVARSIGHRVRHSAHLIRRARWFCLLSESSLAWQTAEPTSELSNLIVLEGGAVANRGFRKRADKIPPPPHFDRPFHSRQRQLNLTSYDRLRVLTTELRRLISEDRQVELRLGPAVILKNDELKRALRWV